jgi:hypothetical protein
VPISKFNAGAPSSRYYDSQLQKSHHLCFILKTDEPFELPEDPDAPVKTGEVLFKFLGLLGDCGKYSLPQNPRIDVGAVLALEVFITASGL